MVLLRQAVSEGMATCETGASIDNPPSAQPASPAIGLSDRGCQPQAATATGFPGAGAPFPAMSQCHEKTVISLTAISGCGCSLSHVFDEEGLTPWGMCREPATRDSSRPGTCSPGSSTRATRPARASRSTSTAGRRPASGPSSATPPACPAGPGTGSGYHATLLPDVRAPILLRWTRTPAAVSVPAWSCRPISHSRWCCKWRCPG